MGATEFDMPWEVVLKLSGSACWQLSYDPFHTEFIEWCVLFQKGLGAWGTEYDRAFIILFESSPFPENQY